jgi:hypothetical protein
MDYIFLRREVRMTKREFPKIYIKSDGEYVTGRKIIEYLISLGAKNPCGMEGISTNRVYFINSFGDIDTASEEFLTNYTEHKL